MKSKISYFCSALLVSSMLTGVSAYAEKVKNIEVSGNNRIERETIINYLSLKKGDEYSSEKENTSIKELYSTHLFDDISLRFSNGLLSVHVTEMPLVVKVEINGNSRVKSSTINREILSHQGTSLNNAYIKLDVEKIKDIYRKAGRFAVSVNAKVEKLENNRSKIIFDIIEGPKTGVRYINFVGNTNYKDSELRSIILTKQSAWFRFMDTSDTYDPDRVEYDKHLLKRFYASLGYADFRVISGIAELSPTRENFTLTYTIEEGEKYKFGSVDLSSMIKEIDAEQFRDLITVKEGANYNAIELENICEKINDKLADLGYTGAVINPEEEKNRDSKQVNVKFVIEKGSKTYIDKINISGNLKTRDNVIRRQLKINEGDLFNRTTINKGEQNIKNLDYFETLKVESVASAKGNNKADVNITVEEKSTSSISFEVGYNSSEGPVGKLNFVERNLVGTGKYLVAGVEKYRKKVSYHIGVTDPYFMDRDLLVGSTFFNNESKVGSEDLPYAQRTYGLQTRAGYEVATDLRHDIAYTIKEDKLSGGSKNVASIFVREQYGKFVTSSISNSLTYDKTDSVVVPKNGYVVSVTETDAGLGGDTKYMKHEADFKIFKSFYNNDFTIKLSGDVGMIHGYGGKKVRMSDRMNLGGFSLRGFDDAGIGPRDKTTGEALGGQKWYTATLELLFPVGLPKEFNVQGSVFTDVGSLWDVDKSPNYNKDSINTSTAPRMSIGVGVVWITRFAPIRLDYAIPIKKTKFDETKRFSFRFSTSF